MYSEWPQLLLAYEVVWLVLCLLIPLLILVVCNVCLIRAIRQSRQLQRLYRANYRAARTTSCRSRVINESDSSNNSQRITPTLIALIIVFIVCVSPSALLFSLYVIGVGDPTSGSKTTYFVYQTATCIANCLFLINFAANFVLYCVVNVRFRCTAREVLCCASSSPAAPAESRRSTWHPGRSAAAQSQSGGLEALPLDNFRNLTLKPAHFGAFLSS